MKSTKVILSLLLTICFCFAGCSSDVNYVDDTKVNLADLIETTAESTVVETIAPTTVHTHEYIKATCTEAKKCKTCDKTFGEPLGHDWKDATCSSPKKCDVCGTTAGKSVEHKWKDVDNSQ